MRGLFTLLLFASKLLLLVFVTGVAGGCAHKAMDYSVDSWRNQPVAAVITEWGKPSEELRVAGKHLLLWHSYDGKLVPPGESRPAPKLVAGGCVRLLEVDRNDRIVTGTWDGNDCPGWLSGWYR